MNDRAWFLRCITLGSLWGGPLVACHPASIDPDLTGTTADPTGTGGETESGTDEPEPAECRERRQVSVTDDALETFARGDFEVAARLLGAIGTGNPNVLLSPFSLRTAFGQVYAGARGASASEIAEVMAFAPLGDDVHDVLNAVGQELESRSAPATEDSPERVVRPINRSFFDVLYEDSVQDDWRELVGDAYGTCIEILDLNIDQQAALDHINGWVAERTNDLIPRLVKAFPEYAALVVVNALYFKAAWSSPFETSLTAPAPFHRRDGSTVMVDMMHAPLHEGGYAEAETWQAATLRYDDRNLEMIVVLPRDGMLETFEAEYDADTMRDIVEAVDAESHYIDLEFPKFEVLSTRELSADLRQLGMVAPFLNRDFDGIAQGMEPIVYVFHDVALGIDEDGTEAAAATAVVFGEDGGPDPESIASVVVDRTFYLMIRDRTLGATLFTGRIGDPTG